MQSTTKAEEYMEVWTRHLYVIGNGIGGATTIYEDNRGAISLADNPINQPKTKHIAVHYHVIQDHIGNGEIRLGGQRIRWLLML